jgi:predicted Zn-dependent peptidase
MITNKALSRIAPLLGVLAGCSTTTYNVPPPQQNVVIPVRDTVPVPKAPVVVKEAPPESGPAKPYRFPKVTWSELSNGLKLATIPMTSLPLVQIRVVVQGGKAADGERPGLASLTGDLLEAGGAGPFSSKDLVTRIESLGANLGIETSFDSTELSLSVTRDHLADALGLLGTIVREPRFDAAEFNKLKKRETERTADSARTSGAWSASMVLYRDLFDLPSDHHPYASYDATPAEVGRITAADCRSLHKRLYIPKNAFVVVAGDTTPEAAKAFAEKAFGAWRGGEAPVISFTDPNPPSGLKITLVDRPKSSQSDIFAAVLGPERVDKSWASIAVANQVLGGGVSSRLFLDVREKQSLAYRTRSSLVEVGHGPAPLIVYAGTQTAKTGLALKGVFDNLEAIGHTAASGEEIDTATRYLADVFAIRMETIGAVAGELAHLRVMGLPDDYDDGYRKELRDITAPLALKAAGEAIRPGHEIVVVAGDAKIIGPMLSHFGEVKVVDPTHDFARIQTIPMNADAPLEVAREAGK